MPSKAVEESCPTIEDSDQCTTVVAWGEGEASHHGSDRDTDSHTGLASQHGFVPHTDQVVVPKMDPTALHCSFPDMHQSCSLPDSLRALQTTVGVVADVNRPHLSEVERAFYAFALRGFAPSYGRESPPSARLQNFLLVLSAHWTERPPPCTNGTSLCLLPRYRVLMMREIAASKNPP